MAFTALTDAHVAVVRISKCLLSEELPRELQIDESAEYAVEIKGDFSFETAGPPKFDPKKQQRGRDRKAEKAEKDAREKKIKEARERRKKGLPPIVEEAEKKDEEEPFALRKIDLKIPRGSLTVVVGRIGAGKSALLSSLIGEVRACPGDVKFGGSVSYVSQQSWIMNATVRENICFGAQKEDAEASYARLERTVYACSLNKDLEQLSDGLDSEIGGMISNFSSCV